MDSFPQTNKLMPVLFVGHGSPMNALEDTEFSRAWAEVGKSLPRPRAILCISAHWDTEGSRITAMDHPRTIHDFYGFPDALYDIRYEAPGSPELAELVAEALHPVPVALDQNWGLDHGTWSVLHRMFPKFDIPVVQLSLDATKGPEFHYELGGRLFELRHRGVLILGSGNTVHNLGLMRWQDTPFDWASEADEKFKDLILAGDHRSLIHYEELGRPAALAIPTNEHYLPLLYILGLQAPEDVMTFFAERVTFGSISMRSLWLG